ncbi:MAG TPA: hypothetical protein VMV01_08940 [Planctomycetota bacterium]|nr:hypothetical protein [Planctomycetota bacterium]
MDPLLAALALLVLGLGFIGFGLSRRLDRVRADLARLDKLDALEKRVEALTAQLEQSDFGATLQSRLAEFTEANLRLAAALAELRQRLPAGKAFKPPPSTPSDAIREHLARLGFDDVHLLTDLESLPELSGRVVFEARRRGVLHKGYVQLAAGRVQSESVQSAYAAFP